MFEKVILFKTVTKNTSFFPEFDRSFADLAEFMSSLGLPHLAMKYLNLANGKNTNVGFVKDKVFRSNIQ